MNVSIVHDPKHKTKLLCGCIETCYLRKDLKYSRVLSEGSFFQTFDQNPIAVLTHLQLLYDHGHYQELVDRYKKLTNLKNAALYDYCHSFLVQTWHSRSLQTGY